MRIFGALRSRMPAHLFGFSTTGTDFPLVASLPQRPVGGRLECFFGHVNSPRFDWFFEEAPGGIYESHGCMLYGWTRRIHRVSKGEGHWKESQQNGNITAAIANPFRLDR
jgi:hypothetical protein